MGFMVDFEKDFQQDLKREFKDNLFETHTSCGSSVQFSGEHSTILLAQIFKLLSNPFRGPNFNTSEVSMMKSCGSGFF